MKTDAEGLVQADTGKGSNLRRTVSAVVLATTCCGHGAAIANPAGATVVNGQVSFATRGNLLGITNSPGAIINWQNFSIGPGEVTRFIQQNSSSSVLNRIVGQEPSKILGAMQSNGRVFLINPNGILFGPGAQVDVNGLVASTLNLSNEDFLAGKRNFSSGKTAGDIRNQGLITTPSGGQVYLIATNVENSGIVTAPQGEVVLAAGHTVQLVDSANPDLHVVVSASDSRALNLGQIIAQGGKVGIYGALINQRGIVNANSAVVGQNGKIVFKASGDTMLEASSRTSATGAGSGGEIHLLGNRVGLVADAIVDASGQTGGGTVLVGGDYHGGNPAIQNATQSYLGPDAEIKADALQSGNGGKVVVWSDDATRAYGAISARGGSLSGNGGLVEASGRFLDMQARVDTRAPRGAIGTLLLDPTDIYIANNLTNAQAAGMSSSDLSAGSASPPFIASGTPIDSLLLVGVLTEALNSSAVTISTSSHGTGAGTIKVVDPVTWNHGFGMNLIADKDIIINGALTGSGTVILYSVNGDISQGVNAPISVTALPAAGIVTLVNPGNNVSVPGACAGGSSFSFANANGFTPGIPSGTYGALSSPNYTGTITGSGLQNHSAPEIATGGGNIALTSMSGAINVGSGIYAGAGSVTLYAGSAINAGAGTISGASLKAIAASGIGNSTMPLATQIAGTLSATNSGASGDINILNTGALVLQNVIQSGGRGNITINNTGPLSVASATSVSSTAGNISLVAHSPLTIAGGVASTSGAINLEAGASGSPDDVLSITGSVSSISGNISLKAGASIKGASLVSTGGSLQQVANKNGSPAPSTPPAPAVPTIGECVATPTLAGCSGVLPTLSQCAVNPSTAGCAAVLPPLQAQSADPLTTATTAAITATNTSTIAMSTPASSGSAASFQEGGAGTASSEHGEKSADGKTASTGQNDSGMKKDHVAKKMYCN